MKERKQRKEREDDKENEDQKVHIFCKGLMQGGLDVQVQPRRASSTTTCHRMANHSRATRSVRWFGSVIPHGESMNGMFPLKFEAMWILLKETVSRVRFSCPARPTLPPIAVIYAIIFDLIFIL